MRGIRYTRAAVGSCRKQDKADIRYRDIWYRGITDPAPLPFIYPRKFPLITNTPITN
jgi:hypothetical protein